ncbi:MAG: hypothetical protein EHM79_02255 [Geobacter sp.]|nr:MAG: hypothetical protein EHM79_02255 [Geobacter sp.]
MTISKKLRTVQILLIVVTLLVFVLSAQIHAAGAPVVAENADVVWQLIIGLFGILNTILMGVIVWIINNQSGIFGRIGKLEAANQVRAALCDERHPESHR